MTKKCSTRVRVWNAFFPIPSALRGDAPSEADPTWLAVRGVEPEALSILHVVRAKVLPLVRDLERRRLLRSFSFLVHDRSGGVPTTEDDHSVYVHLRLQFARTAEARKLLSKEWVMVRSVQPTAEETEVHRSIDPQAAWYLDFVERHAGLGDLALLERLRQQLHYFANMSQMRIS